MENIKATILYFGRANSNGKVYDINDFDNECIVPVIIDKHNGHGMHFLEQAGSAKLTKNGFLLDAEITLTGDHCDDAKKKIDAGEKFAPSGTGYVDSGGYIRQYKLMRIIITDKPANTY